MKQTILCFSVEKKTQTKPNHNKAKRNKTITIIVDASIRQSLYSTRSSFLFTPLQTGAVHPDMGLTIPIVGIFPGTNPARRIYSILPLTSSPSPQKVLVLKEKECKQLDT